MSGIDNRDKKQGVKFFKRRNLLKIKAGASEHSSDTPGRIDPDRIAEADKHIDTFCKDCPKMVSAVLVELDKKWGAMMPMQNSPERHDLAQKMFILAHEIKDVAGMCGYVLMSDFAESLRDYVVEEKLNLEAQRVIVQAHVDVMKTAFKQGIKADGGPAAEELKEALKKAISKYF